MLAITMYHDHVQNNKTKLCNESEIKYLEKFVQASVMYTLEFPFKAWD